MAERRNEPGPVVGRAIDALRELPPANAETVQRIVAAAAQTRGRDVDPNEDTFLAQIQDAAPRHRLPTAIAAAALIVAASVSVALWRATHSVRALSIAPTAVAPSAAGVDRVVAATAAADASIEAAPVPTQFVFDGQARRVALVGDFNNWDEHATPLVREPGSSLWSVTVPIQRGRHIYAYLVDSVWTIDRRAPIARDPDFGVRGSVILVGRP